MPELILDGRPLQVAEGTTVAAALALGGDGSSRTSVGGQRRAPVCGMGVCQECRVTIDGQPAEMGPTEYRLLLRVESQP